MLTATDKIGSTAEIFHNVAAAAGRRPAIRHGATELTYAELAAAAGGVAAWLRDQRIGRGDVVATLLDRSAGPVVSMLAVWAVGAAYVHVDPADPDHRVASLLQQARADAILTDGKNRGRLSNLSIPVLAIDSGVRLQPYEVDRGLSPDDLAYLVFTSGSTGIPKAVAVEHRAVLNHHTAIWRRRGLIEIDSFGLTATLAVDFGLDSVFGALFTGARLDVYAPETLLNPVAFAVELAEHPVDFLVYTPTLLEALCQIEELGSFLPRRMLVIAGEPFPPRLAAAILGVRPELPTFNSYGPSETTIEIMQHKVRQSDAHRARIPIGRPLDRVILRVLDGDGVDVPDGAAGVLYVGGPCVARGYANDPAATARKFQVADNGERFYCTDDIVVRTTDGSYEFLGRADRQVKIRGYRVEPGEVEAALLAQPEILRALVTAEPVSPSLPADLVAYVVTGSPISRTQILERLTSMVAPALVPSRIHVVPRMPVTHSGKADLAALQSMIIIGPAGSGPARTSAERTIADVWCKVLGRTDVGLNERFLQVGGNSLKAMQVFGELRRHYPDLTIADLFRHPTVAALAQALAKFDVSASSAPVVVAL